MNNELLWVVFFGIVTLFTKDNLDLIRERRWKESAAIFFLFAAALSLVGLKMADLKSPFMGTADLIKKIVEAIFYIC